MADDSNDENKDREALDLARDRDWLGLQCLLSENSGNPGHLKSLLCFTLAPSDPPERDDDGAVLPTGRTALHEACLAGAPSSLVRSLLDICPEAAETFDDDGCSALHLACQRTGAADAEVVRMLVERFPEATLRTDNSSGNTPLHSALINGAPVQVIEALVSAGPEASGATNRVGVKTPLETAIDVASVEALAAIARAAAALPDKEHLRVPLRRVAVLANRSIDLALGAAFEPGRRRIRQDWFGGIAAAHAVMPLAESMGLIEAEENDATVAKVPSVIAFCSHFFPTAAQVWRDMLVRLRNGGRKKRKKDGSTPKTATMPLLSAALRLAKGPPKSGEVLVWIDPGLASEADKERGGELPLHVALHKRLARSHRMGWLRTVRAVLRAHPRAASVRDPQSGLLPLRLLELVCGEAWWDNYYEGVVMEMIEAHPVAVFSSGRGEGRFAAEEGSLVPACLAAVGAGCGLDALFRLVRGAPDAVFGRCHSS